MKKNKQRLYEAIMQDVSKIIKKHLNEEYNINVLDKQAAAELSKLTDYNYKVVRKSNVVSFIPNDKDYYTLTYNYTEDVLTIDNGFTILEIQNFSNERYYYYNNRLTIPKYILNFDEFVPFIDFVENYI